MEKIASINTIGCYKVTPKIFSDQRGVFVKTYIDGLLQDLGVSNSDFVEEFYSISTKNVIRGMHFQRPPVAHSKMVVCVSGRVLDVIVDLRKGSPTFLKTEAFVLAGKNPEMLFLPPGIAHGFLALSPDSIMMYKVTSCHSPEHDSGVKWNSIDFVWPVREPVISLRDNQLPELSEFESPFVFGEKSR